MVGQAFLPLLLALALGLGCGRSSTRLEPAEKLRAAIAAETGDPHTLLMVENGTIRIQSGSESIAISQAGTQARPAGIPDDIVLPTDSRYDLWSEGPRGSTLSLLTDLSPEHLEGFFREQWPAHSWQEATEVQADTLRRITFGKDGCQVAITIEPDPENAPATRALLFIENHSND